AVGGAETFSPGSPGGGVGGVLVTGAVSSPAPQKGGRAGGASTPPPPRGQGGGHPPGEPPRSRRLRPAPGRRRPPAAPRRSGARAVLQRHAGERHETPLGLRRGELGVVEETAPGLPFRRWQLIAEPVRPASDHVTVDPLLVHPSETSGNVAQTLHDRARRLAA